MFGRPILFLALSAALFTACSSEIDSPAPSTARLLQDSWTWQQSSGGFTGQVLTPAGTGDQQQLEFGADGQVRHYRNGRLVSTDTYELRRGPSRLDGQPTTLVQYGRGLGQSLTLSNTELILRDEAADGQQHVYSR